MKASVEPVDRILDAAEQVLRRHGAGKANVVDVARVLGMSHGNIYRHFPSKKAMLEAVAARWLATLTGPLATIADDRTRSAGDRLAAWFVCLRRAKRKKILDDPELFRVHHDIAKENREVADEHVAALRRQVRQIIAAGVASGEFRPDTRPAAAARAFLHATAAFHHPALVAQPVQPTEADVKAVITLLIAGLTVREVEP